MVWGTAGAAGLARLVFWSTSGAAGSTKIVVWRFLWGGGVRPTRCAAAGGDPPESHFLMIFSILEIGTCEDPGERVREYRMPVSSDLGIVDYWMQVQSTRFEASRASADYSKYLIALSSP